MKAAMEGKAGSVAPVILSKAVYDGGEEEEEGQRTAEDDEVSQKINLFRTSDRQDDPQERVR